ncbi:hypothetical protein [Pilibacter termitis]|uniref:hypothetical protein n=1 Tax=Pilibacter termitis TaxID=263852 RepID=UPI00118605F0|nr:hypothetical protein [Pilibacter termitis]
MLLRTVAKLQPLVARHRKAMRGGLKFATVSHSIYLLETKFQVLLRTVAKLQPLVARHRKAMRVVQELVTANHVVHLLETSVSSDIVSSRPTPAPHS